MSNPLTLHCPILSVRFHSQDDRFAHSIYAGDSDQPLLTSIEGGAADWPASPPLQEVHLEQRPGGAQVALAVGMAGSSHWSLSCELRPAGEDAMEVEFDVACRLKQPPDQLGSSYLLGENVSLKPGDTGSWQLQTPGGAWQLTADEATIEEAGRLIFPAPPAAGELPATVRWGYRLRVASSEG